MTVKLPRRLPTAGALGALTLAFALSACATTPAAPAKTSTLSEDKPKATAAVERPNPNPYPSTYTVKAHAPTAIVGATVFTATGQKIENGVVLFDGGKITAVGAGLEVPAGYTVIDGKGKWVTPGVIDSHSHLGVFPSPGVQGHADGNENVDPNTAQVWAEHSIWPQDPGFNRARAGGVTSLLILPGSANLFGGRGVSVKNVQSVTMQGMKFPDAPYHLKMACGENPKGRYGSRGRSPATRMGNVAGYRRAWIDAAEYNRKWDAYEKKRKNGDSAEAPKRDLQLETLGGVLKGELLVQNHCYRADEMAVMIDVSKEFGYHTTAFHHATEAYKIGDLLAKEDICVAIWASRFGFKMEAYDGIEENAGLLYRKGACFAIHSDEARLIQRLNVESAIALSAARRAGIDITEEEAVKWFTINAAKIMGVDKQTGSLEPGKMADVVLWSKNPFSIYAVAEKVYVDGTLVHDANDPSTQNKSDVELGHPYGGL